jgi:hypothetical protein
MVHVSVIIQGRRKSFGSQSQVLLDGCHDWGRCGPEVLRFVGSLPRRFFARFVTMK